MREEFCFGYSADRWWERSDLPPRTVKQRVDSTQWRAGRVGANNKTIQYCPSRWDRISFFEPPFTPEFIQSCKVSKTGKDIARVLWHQEVEKEFGNGLYSGVSAVNVSDIRKNTGRHRRRRILHLRAIFPGCCPREGIGKVSKRMRWEKLRSGRCFFRT